MTPTEEPEETFAFETVTAGQKWEVVISSDLEAEHPFVLYRIDGDDPAFVAAAGTVDDLVSLVRDSYCAVPEKGQADISDEVFDSMVQWAEQWESIIHRNE